MISMNKFLIGCLLGIMSLHSCKTKETLKKPIEADRPKIDQIDNLKDDQGNYVFIEKDGSIKVNEILVEKSGICQALLNQQAFNWTIVLSPSKSTRWDLVKECQKEIESCYEKFKMVKAVDTYDKIYKDLNENQKAQVDEWYPLHLIITAPRKK